MAEMQAIKINEVQKYLFDARDEPVLRVKCGETFRVETDDALTGLVKDERDNPGGGDVLAIEIESSEPWRWGYVGIVPGNGALRDSFKWGAECRDAHIQLIEHL